MKGAIRFAAIGGGILVVLLIAGFILAAIFGVLLDVLYIALIILAVFSLLSTLLLIYALVMLMRMISTVREETKPLIASMQETVGIVQATARTAGHTASTVGNTAQLAKEFAIGPSVRTAAAVFAGQQVLRVFLGKGHTRSRAEQRRKQQMELEMEAATGGK